MSDEIERETAGYMDDNDKVTEFLNTVNTEGSEKDMIPHEWLRNSYNTWAESRGFKSMNDRTFPAAMVERDFKRVQIHGLTQWKRLKISITKIVDIYNQYPFDKYEKLMEQLQRQSDRVGVEEDKRISVDIKTLSGEEVEVITKIIKRNKKNSNNGNGSCEIYNSFLYFSNKPLPPRPNPTYLILS